MILFTGPAVEVLIRRDKIGVQPNSIKVGQLKRPGNDLKTFIFHKNMCSVFKLTLQPSFKIFWFSEFLVRIYLVRYMIVRI